MTALDRHVGISRSIILAAAALAIALPLFVLLFRTPLSNSDLQQFALIHLRPEFWTRAALTFLYFPGAIVLHLLARPSAPHLREFYLAGFALFLAGNGIDAAYRSVQYLTVHGVWAGQLLDPATATAAAGKLATFNDVSPAIVASFSMLFAVGRLMMGAALIAERSTVFRIAGALLALNGLFNLATVAGHVDWLSWVSLLSPFYAWPWLLSLILVAVVAWRRSATRTTGGQAATAV